MAEARVERRLAAILAADVVGYSRLMGADEAGTLAALKRHRETIFDPAVTAHNGRIVKLMGDGAIVEFGSVVDAVNCALSVQRSGAALPDATARQPTTMLRIGINLGDVIIENDDIYGDGVNIAARLEPLAEPGGICVSSIVHESVGNRIDVRFQDGGDISVKNIDRPIRVWKWHPGTIATNAQRSNASNPLPNVDTPSIAVLPFTNMSGDPEQEYFSDGISEDVITAGMQFGGGLNAGHMQDRSHHRKRLRVDAPRNRQIGDSALELLNQPGCVFVAALAAKTDALKLALDEIEVTERNGIIGTT